MPTKKNPTVPKEIAEYDFNKSYLDNLFKEANEKGEFLWPDDAFRNLMAYHQRIFERDGNFEEIKEKWAIKSPKLDLIAKARETHLYAVKLFYQTYMPRVGAPPIHPKHIAYLIKLKRQGMSLRDIALHMEPDLKTAEEIEAAREKYKKRIESVEKRKSKEPKD